jgi:hypothetical protein
MVDIVEPEMRLDDVPLREPNEFDFSPDGEEIIIEEHGEAYMAVHVSQ